MSPSADPATQTVRLAVFVSGGGTNLQALIDASEADPAIPYQIVCVVTDREGTGGQQRAEKHGIPVELALPPRGVSRPEARKIISDKALAICREYKAEALILAGFLTIMCGDIISAYTGKMINLHPALLPKFGGPGMWGHHVHEAVLAAGETESGCSIHLVDAGCDTGEVLIQRRVPVLPGDNAETLARRIYQEEHVAIVEGAIELSKRLQAWTAANNVGN